MEYPNTRKVLIELAHDISWSTESQENFANQINDFLTRKFSTTQLELAEKLFSKLSPVQLSDFIGGDPEEIEKTFSGFEGCLEANIVLNGFFLDLSKMSIDIFSNTLYTPHRKQKIL